MLFQKSIINNNDLIMNKAHLSFPPRIKCGINSSGLPALPTGRQAVGRESRQTRQNLDSGSSPE